MLNLKMLAIGFVMLLGMGTTAVIAKPTLNVLAESVKAHTEQQNGLTSTFANVFSGSANAPASQSNDPQKTKTPRPTEANEGKEKETPEANETHEANNQRVAEAIAKFFGVPVSDITMWHDKGFGYGEIVKAYSLAQMTDKSVADIFAMKKNGEGWGNIEKSLCGEAGNPNPSLGDIMSGHAAKIAGGKCSQHGKGKENENGNNGHASKSDDGEKKR